MIGPNVKKLITARSAKVTEDRIKARGEKFDIGTSLAELANGNAIKDLKEACDWTKLAMAAIAEADTLRQWPDDEARAGEVLRLLEERAKQGNK